MPTVEVINYWKPSISEADVRHLKALGLRGAVIKGNPYRSHLTKPGEPKALCGAKPGSSSGTRKMVDRTGWRVYESFERPGCAPCEDCLRAAEKLSPTETASAPQRVPDDVRRYAKSMQKDGYRGPLNWAKAIIDWVADAPEAPACDTPVYCRSVQRCTADDARRAALEAPAPLILQDFIARQVKFSAATFGPGSRTEGVVDHIIKELNEVLTAADPTNALEEWVDVVLLALDGAWRAGFTPQQICDALVAKLSKNELRQWPDWRTAEPGKAIEHVRV